MKCYYEILEVNQNADETVIKTAYRKLALKWHPDKNIDDVENAKEQFQLIQQAYEVLSDRQERAWYDAHREQFIRGKNSDFQDVSLNVYQYFTISCYQGYDDSPKSFYTVYRDVFENIAKEDLEFMTKEDYSAIPMFGKSTSDYDVTVGPFYSYWTNYNTKKSFTWLDEYNTQEIKHRRTVKFLDKENKKIRQKARQERNEEVRALVNFVRKRDRRVQEHTKILTAKITENRLKQVERGKRERLQRKKELEESSSQAEWMNFDNVIEQLNEIEKDVACQFGEEISNDESEENELLNETNHFYCYACNKIFKTSKAFQNHELSRKHKENLEKLKKDVRIDDEECNSNSSEVNNVDLTENQSEDISIQSDDECFDEIPIKINNQKKKRKKSKAIGLDSESENISINADKTISETLEQIHFDNDVVLTKKQKRKVKKGKTCDNGKELKLNHVHSEKNQQNNDSNKSQEKHRKNEPKSYCHNDININNCCVTCKSNFPSKNKLFDHLKKTGHSVYLPQNKTENKNH